MQAITVVPGNPGSASLSQVEEPPPAETQEDDANGEQEDDPGA